MKGERVESDRHTERGNGESFGEGERGRWWGGGNLERAEREKRPGWMGGGYRKKRRRDREWRRRERFRSCIAAFSHGQSATEFI